MRYIFNVTFSTRQKNCLIHALIKRTTLVFPTASDLADLLNTNALFVKDVGVSPWLSINKVIFHYYSTILLLILIQIWFCNYIYFRYLNKCGFYWHLKCTNYGIWEQGADKRQSVNLIETLMSEFSTECVQHFWNAQQQNAEHGLLLQYFPCTPSQNRKINKGGI
jgi:hypothetical protein